MKRVTATAETKRRRVRAWKRSVRRRDRPLASWALDRATHYPCGDFCGEPGTAALVHVFACAAPTCLGTRRRFLVAWRLRWRSAALEAAARAAARVEMLT